MVSPIIPFMRRINVVIDTNVLVSALRSKNGVSHQLLLLIDENLYQPNVSVPLLFEYEEVLKRRGLIKGLSEQEINDVLDYLLSKSSLREIYFLWRPFLKDPKDDLVLEVAVESNSKYIITFNKKDFEGSHQFNIKVVTPFEFLEREF